MTRGMRMAALASIGIVCLSGAIPAAAQVILTSPGAVANCLCLERSINDLRAEMDASKNAHDLEQLRLDILRDQVEQQRPRVNVDDPASIEAFKALLDRLDAAQARFHGEITSRYGDSVQRHNEAVRSFEAPCRGKFYDADILAALSPTLNCPRP